MIVLENISLPDCCAKCFLYLGSSGGACLGGNYGDIRYINSALVDFERDEQCPIHDLGDMSIDELKEKISCP